MENTPIYDFQMLKDLLTQKGYRIGKAEPWRKIDSEEVSLREGKLEFYDDGIFLIDDDGIKRQVFLYKRAMYLHWEGQPKKPTFHICKCQTIDLYLHGTDIPEYRRANTKSVKVLDKSNNMKETEISDLPLCKNCASMVYKNMNYNLNSSEFSDIIRKAASVEENMLSDAEVNTLNGYTKNWPEISTAYRVKHNYTCEKCGIQVSPLETEFMQVHHINKNKIDNRESNLQCLCIKCHSEVDPTHIHNFSKPNQRLLIKLFLEKYGERE